MGSNLKGKQFNVAQKGAIITITVGCSGKAERVVIDHLAGSLSGSLKRLYVNTVSLVTFQH